MERVANYFAEIGFRVEVGETGLIKPLNKLSGS